MKLIRDNYDLKTYQRRHYLRDIVGNHSKKLLLYGTQNETKMLMELVVKWIKNIENINGAI